MDERLDNLEREVEAELGLWSDRLSVTPAPGVVDHVKSAVRHELNEGWLTDQSQPAPMPGTLARVQAAVRQELARESWPVGQAPGMAARMRPVAWPLSLSGLAAAAMIVICFGVVRYAGMIGSSISPERPVAEAVVSMVVQAAEEEVDSFIAAAQEVLADDSLDSFPASTLMELEAIEEDVSPLWTTQGFADEGLDELADEIDTLGVEIESWAA